MTEIPFQKLIVAFDPSIRNALVEEPRVDQTRDAHHENSHVPLLPRLDDGGVFLHRALLRSIDDNKSIYLKSGRRNDGYRTKTDGFVPLHFFHRYFPRCCVAIIWRNIGRLCCVYE